MISVTPPRSTAQAVITAVTLTDTTPNSTTTATQWGTEEAIVAEGDLPATNFVVMAWVNGRAKPNASVAQGDRWTLDLQYSLDGGSGWTTFAGGSILGTASHASTTGSNPCGSHAYASLTSTGNGVQVRAIFADIAQAGDFTAQSGRLSILVAEA